MRQETIDLLREFYPPEMHLDHQTVSFIPATWGDILAVLEAAVEMKRADISMADGEHDSGLRYMTAEAALLALIDQPDVLK